MTHSTNKNPFKNQGLAVLWYWWQVLASVLARKNRLKSMRCHKWRKLSGRGFKQASKQEKKKAGERECKWNVNKPYRIVNQKVAKSTKRKTLRQFTHSSI